MSGTSTQSATASLTGSRPLRHAVANRYQDAVRQQQVEGRLPQLSVELQGVVMSHRAVDQRNPGGQQEHEQDQVHAGQPGNDAQGGDAGGDRRDSGRAAVGQPQ
jgi:hypothetical protein